MSKNFGQKIPFNLLNLCFLRLKWLDKLLLTSSKHTDVMSHLEKAISKFY